MAKKRYLDEVVGEYNPRVDAIWNLKENRYNDNLDERFYNKVRNDLEQERLDKQFRRIEDEDITEVPKKQTTKKKSAKYKARPIKKKSAQTNSQQKPAENKNTKPQTSGNTTNKSTTTNKADNTNKSNNISNNKNTNINNTDTTTTIKKNEPKNHSINKTDSISQRTNPLESFSPYVTNINGKQLLGVYDFQNTPNVNYNNINDNISTSQIKASNNVTVNNDNYKPISANELINFYYKTLGDGYRLQYYDPQSNITVLQGKDHIIRFDNEGNIRQNTVKLGDLGLQYIDNMSIDNLLPKEQEEYNGLLDIYNNEGRSKLTKEQYNRLQYLDKIVIGNFANRPNMSLKDRRGLSNLKYGNDLDNAIFAALTGFRGFRPSIITQGAKDARNNIIRYGRNQYEQNTNIQNPYGLPEYVQYANPKPKVPRSILRKRGKQWMPTDQKTDNTIILGTPKNIEYEFLNNTSRNYYDVLAFKYGGRI